MSNETYDKVMMAVAGILFLCVLTLGGCEFYTRQVERRAEIQHRIEVIREENERLEEIKQWQLEYVERLRQENYELREMLHIPHREEE